MRVPRIYTGLTLTAESTFDLEPGPSQHIARALRMQAGGHLVLFDGRGGEYPATIDSLGKNSVTVTTGEHRDRELESPLAIHLGMAIARGERMDWVVQKATELGVSQITPLFTDRTEVKLAGDRADKKLRHWQQVAISASEQCGRNTLPRINALSGLSSWLAVTEADCKLVLHPRGEGGMLPGNPPGSAMLLVGPEGGLSSEEIQMAETAGCACLSLGPRVMRTETAPLAAIAILQARWGDMEAYLR